MYLINAIYFKSSWASKFEPAKTQQMPFTLPDSSQVQADFMKGAINCNTYNDPHATLIELPYSNNKYSMVIVMPKSGKSINDIIPALDGTSWQTWMGQVSSTSVNFSMPKFQYSYSVRLNDALKNMGMGIAFSTAADFTRINPAGGLEITSVDHKAYIAVDETGTEAAAATSVKIGASAVLEQQITVDHPFIFVIREMKTGLILFAGTVNNPCKTDCKGTLLTHCLTPPVKKK
jgi:serpin B